MTKAGSWEVSPNADGKTEANNSEPSHFSVRDSKERKTLKNGGTVSASIKGHEEVGKKRRERL